MDGSEPQSKKLKLDEEIKSSAAVNMDVDKGTVEDETETTVLGPPPLPQQKILPVEIQSVVNTIKNQVKLLNQDQLKHNKWPLEVKKYLFK